MVVGHMSAPSVWSRARRRRSVFVRGTCVRRCRSAFLVKGAFGLGHPGQTGFMFCKFAGALVGAQQIAAFHQGEPRAALAIGSNLASGTNRKVAFANTAEALELRRVMPDLAEPFVPQVSCRLGQLHAGIDIAVRRNVAAIVSRAARQVPIGRAFKPA